MRLRKSIFVVSVVLFLIAVTEAQQVSSPSIPGPATSSLSDAPDACAHSFTGTGGNNSILYCVSDNGNITNLETPLGVSQIGAHGEGYGLCQESPTVEYHDYSVDVSNNWAAAQVLSQSSTSIKISRVTAEGDWALLQTITKVATTGSIKVVMALTNRQNVDRVAYLVRFADATANDNSVNGAGAAAVDSAWAWHVDTGDASTFHYGLQLQNAAKSPFSYQYGFLQSVATGPNACAFAFNDTGGLEDRGGRDVSILYAYVGVVHARETKTVTLTYHSM